MKTKLELIMLKDGLFATTNVLVCQSCRRLLVQDEQDEKRNDAPASNHPSLKTFACCVKPDYKWERAFVYKTILPKNVVSGTA